MVSGMWIDHEFRLYGYSDLDWAESIPDQKSTSAYYFSLGSNMVSWSSKKQSCVSLSTTEVEYVATCETCRETVWLQNLLSGLFGLKLEVTYIWCDKLCYMNFSENLVFHDKSKHIKIKYHYIRDMVQRRAVRLQYVTTEEYVAGMLTKPLLRTKFDHFKNKLGMVLLQRE
jgi:hypothetical protein